MNPRFATFGAGVLVALVAAQSLGMLGGAAPYSLSPAPMLFAALLAAGMNTLLIPAAFAALFWLWSPQLFRGETSVPKRTFVLLAVSAGLSIANFVVGWTFGVRYQGLAYTIACLLTSAGMLTVCAVILWKARATPSFDYSLLAHTVAFAWLGSYAFPYLGPLR
jgi:hypothetical protein